MVRLLVVSDIRLFREGLRDLLVKDGRLDVAGTASSIGEALGLTRARAPDVLLLDMGLPDALSSIRSLRAACSATRIVPFGISERQEDVVACAEAGASGYVCRESDLEELVRAVTDAVREELHCPARISAALLHHVARLAALRDPGEQEVRLTPREGEVAELLDRGLSNKEIADRLCIEIPTVKAHVHNILDKLGCHRRSQATARLRRLGLLRTTPRLPRTG